MAAEIREDYLESLQELTVASRPIIKTLTEIAQENVENAPAIVDAIDQHSMECPPNQKLPALYLIDSVCKNNGEPFPSLFAPRIVRIFSAAFELSPEPTRIKLSEQFKTWTVPSELTGQPLFPHEILRELQAFMAGPMPARGGPAPPPARPAPQRLTQSSLLVEINRHRSALEQDPADPFSEKQLQMLDRFEAQVSGVADPKVLPQIQAELETLRASREFHLARQPPHAGRRRNDRRDGRRVASGGRDGRSRPSRGGVDKFTGANNVPLGTRARVPPPSEPELAAMNQALTRGGEARDAGDDAAATPEPELAGLAFGPGLPLPPLNVPLAMPVPVPELLAKLPSQPASAAASPEPAPASSLDLVAASKTDASPEQIGQLYAPGLPLQCSTCGYRFHDTAEGREAKQAEMDWHFRANKDIREGRSRSRSWFLAAVQWIQYRDEDEVFGAGSPAGGADLIAATPGTTAAPVDLDKEREKYIEVPLDSNARCPVCQEPHETSWSEEAENWVWMNTVDIDGLYFHATCYADPQNKDLVASVLDSK